MAQKFYAVNTPKGHQPGQEFLVKAKSKRVARAIAEDHLISPIKVKGRKLKIERITLKKNALVSSRSRTVVSMKASAESTPSLQ